MKAAYVKAGTITVLSILLLSALASAAITAADFSKVPKEIICALDTAFITIAGALAGLIIVVAGVIWIAAHDNPSKRQGAKSAIINAVIGLIVVSLAHTIVIGVGGMIPCT